MTLNIFYFFTNHAKLNENNISKQSIRLQTFKLKFHQIFLHIDHNYIKSTKSLLGLSILDLLSFLC